MKTKHISSLFKWAAIVYWLLALIVFLTANEQFRQKDFMTETITAAAATEALSDDVVVAQPFIASGTTITGVELLVDPHGGVNEGALQIGIQDSANGSLLQETVELSGYTQKGYVSIEFPQPLAVKAGQKYTLVLQAEGCSETDRVNLFYGTTIDTGHYEVSGKINEEDFVLINNQKQEGKLCVRFAGQKALLSFALYWPACLFIFVVAAWLLYRSEKKAQAGEASIIAHIELLSGRYAFLVKQLISRDFKAKYKRSALGVAWSFLNPLLTMCVQYVVFSTLFQRDTANYPVYLLTGIVFFGFFNEAINMGMTSITSNASLIKKVYMPKYIYPLTRVVSSLINFLIALIPLLFVMLVTGTTFRPALLLLPFDIMCLFVFVSGMSLLLSTSMTFFQDTKFLWSVVSMMWMYLTPIFYMESIIPKNILPFYRLNPMYQYITFARTCIIDGISPEPIMYVQCVLSALIVMAAGIYVFKKNHNKFIMHI